MRLRSAERAKKGKANVTNALRRLADPALGSPFAPLLGGRAFPRGRVCWACSVLRAGVGLAPAAGRSAVGRGTFRPRAPAVRLAASARATL